MRSECWIRILTVNIHGDGNINMYLRETGCEHRTSDASVSGSCPMVVFGINVLILLPQCNFVGIAT
jgi:hypothetical protein